MPLDADLISMMHHHVQVALVTSKDRYNNFTWAAASDQLCSIEKTNKAVRDIQGREVTSTVQIVFADPTIELTTDSKITLPDGTDPAIIEVLAADDEDGPYYLEARA